MAVYKITFDNKYFYIGSSVNARKRYRYWKCQILNHSYAHNKKILDISLSSKLVEFSILVRFDDKSKLREYEVKLLKENDGNPLFLNKQTGVHHPKPKTKKSPSKNLTPSIKIALFDKEGNWIKNYKSKGELIRENKGCRVVTINKVLRGEMRFAGGFKFKLINEDGSFLEPVPYKKDLHRRESFYQIDKSGNIINTFNYSRDAVKSTGALRTNISTILLKSGSRRYAKGFTFVYVSEYEKGIKG